ncbi:MAG: LytTR family transcriptional regulator [Bacteroidales bacterium]|nr:LytTR family transcriptional regulator [Bacteroidales bacterium]
MNLIFALAVPAFFLVSVFLYEPAALCRLMTAGAGNVSTFNIIICFTIILGVMLLSRLLLWLLRKHMSMDLYKFFAWCLIETLVYCAFTGLFLVLMNRGEDGWFSWFGRSISAIGSVSLYPYIILTLLAVANENYNAEPVQDGVRLKFYDNRHQLKFITESSSVLYIESNENYIVVHYLENGIEKRFQLRNTLKNLEPLCEQAGFARAHRCFIVNPKHVKSIRKDSSGLFFADLGVDREEGIPLSKKYYGSIAAMLD